MIGGFTNDEGHGNEDVKKTIGLLCKTTTLHVHHAYFASTAQPGTQNDNIWARWPAKAPPRLLISNMM